MKKLYQTPDIDLVILSAEEIRTDVISASQPSNVDSMKWKNFIEG